MRRFRVTGNGVAWRVEERVMWLFWLPVGGFQYGRTWSSFARAMVEMATLQAEDARERGPWRPAL